MPVGTVDHHSPAPSYVEIKPSVVGVAIDLKLFGVTSLSERHR
jgi:hypothetical protein